MPVQLDLNRPRFQQDWFDLEKNEATALLKTLRKIVQLDWTDIYRDAGLNWEAVIARTDARGTRLYTIRVTQKCRALVQRRDELMIFLELHPDHDGAYER
ncbi:MAG: hypothetical protein HC933_16290 [Pleurocapsa sp. SU_196_0]|nr:hypothetical protein [Pleurocapsa sp. SU_196_0]